MRKRKTTELDAVAWLKTNANHIVLKQWGGFGKDKSVFLDTRRNIEFVYTFNSLKERILRDAQVLFFPTKEEKENKRKETVYANHNEYYVFNIPEIREKTILANSKHLDNPNLNKEYFYQKYIVEELSLQKIGELIGLSYTSVHHYFHKFEIPIRTKSNAAVIRSKDPNYIEKQKVAHAGKVLSENHKKKISESRIKLDLTGPKSSTWKPPEQRKTYLGTAIRESMPAKEWKKKIMKRDGYKCVACDTAKNLEIDHIEPLSYLIKKNNIKILEEAFACEELWNIDNGRVLCRKCHAETDTYLYKAKNYVSK